MINIILWLYEHIVFPLCVFVFTIYIFAVVGAIMLLVWVFLSCALGGTCPY